jgi:hypothetical protein
MRHSSVAFSSTIPGVPAAPPALTGALRPSVAANSRWSADGWLLLRKDTTTPFLSGRPVMDAARRALCFAIDFAPASSHRPQGYLRASAALAGEREQEVAVGSFGASGRALPLRVRSKRGSEKTDRGTNARPAAYAVTELAPFRLPAGRAPKSMRKRGYVGGAFATPFVRRAGSYRPAAVSARRKSSSAPGRARGAGRREDARGSTRPDRRRLVPARQGAMAGSRPTTASASPAMPSPRAALRSRFLRVSRARTFIPRPLG